MPSNTFGKAYVVVAKRPETKELVVAFEEPDTPGLFATRCRVGSISVTNRPLANAGQLLAQPRYRSAASPVTLSFTYSTESLLVGRLGSTSSRRGAGMTGTSHRNLRLLIESFRAGEGVVDFTKLTSTHTPLP